MLWCSFYLCCTLIRFWEIFLPTWPYLEQHVYQNSAFFLANMLNQPFLDRKLCVNHQINTILSFRFKFFLHRNLSLIHIAALIFYSGNFMLISMRNFPSNTFIWNNMLIRFLEIFLTTLLLGLHGY